MTIYAVHSDCGLKIIGDWFTIHTKNTRQYLIDLDINAIINLNKEYYNITGIQCSLLEKTQEDLYKYLITKYNFTQITPWHPSKTNLIIKNNNNKILARENIATFFLPLYPNEKPYI